MLCFESDSFQGMNMYYLGICVQAFMLCDEDTPLIFPMHCQPAGLGARADCEDHAWAVYLT